MLENRPNAQVTSLVFNIAPSGQSHLRQCLFVWAVEPRAWGWSAQRTTNRRSVPVTSGGIILALLGGPAASAFFASTAMATMASVPAMPKHMHGDKGDRDQDPEPVCRYPIHET